VKAERLHARHWPGGRGTSFDGTSAEAVADPAPEIQRTPDASVAKKVPRRWPGTPNISGRVRGGRQAVHDHHWRALGPNRGLIQVIQKKVSECWRRACTGRPQPWEPQGFLLGSWRTED